MGKYPVTGIRDLGVPSYDSSKPDGKPTLPTSASSPMISVTFENGTVAQFRASGTEPKFKVRKAPSTPPPLRARRAPG